MSRALLEKRASVWAQMQEIRDNVAKDGWTAELRETWDRADAEIETLSADIERAQRDGELEARFAAVDANTVISTGDGKAERADNAVEEHRAAFRQYLIGGENALNADQRALVMKRAAMGEGTGVIGGYSVPQGFWAKVTETLKYFGGAEAGATVLNTDTGIQIPWPTNDDTANTGRLVAENVQHTETDLTFGQKTLTNYTFSSDIVLVSEQLLQDSGVDIEAFIAKKLGQRIARAQNTYFTTGTGTSQPQGFITGASAGVTAASTSTIVYDDIVNLVHSVDVAYREGGMFKCHDNTLKVIRKIRDDSGGAGLGRPIWEPMSSPITGGLPATILGYPFVVDNDMASAVTTGLKTLCFGNFGEGFVVRHVTGGSLKRLVERYADYLQVGFIGWDRADSLVQDSGAIKYLTQL